MYSHPALATRESGDIHESRDRSVFFLQQKRRDIKDIPAVVENALLSTALGDLLLLLLIDLGGLRLDFAGTGERSVNYWRFREYVSMAAPQEMTSMVSTSDARAERSASNLFPCLLAVGWTMDAVGE